MKRKKYAIVGTGSRAQLYIDGLCNHFRDYGELVALCDSNQTRMDYHKKIINEKNSEDVLPTYLSHEFERMIKEKDVQVVIVTSIDRTHHLYITSAIKLGCDVITEKPLTTDIKYSDNIFQTINDYDKNIIVTFNYRYTPRNAKIKELLMDDIIGKITSLHFEWLLDTSHGADYFRRWHRDKRNSGGLMVHKASHHFDLINWWLNAIPVSVYGQGDLVFYGKKNAEERGNSHLYYRATGSNNADKDPFALKLSGGILEELYLNAEDEDGYLRDQSVFGDGISIEDDMSLIVNYNSGATMTYHLSAYSPWEGFRIAFNGTKGRIEYFVEENSYVSGSFNDVNSPNNKTIRTNLSNNKILIRPHWKEPFEIELPPEVNTGHGGGDMRMLNDIFCGATNNKLMQLADHRAGAASLLVGFAANDSFRKNIPINIQKFYGDSLTVKSMNEFQ